MLNELVSLTVSQSLDILVSLVVSQSLDGLPIKRLTIMDTSISSD